jgi:predicted nucleic acid-binding Zn ribbon protein
MGNKCVICSETIPEGTQVCPTCWKEIMEDKSDEDNKISQSSI